MDLLTQYVDRLMDGVERRMEQHDRIACSLANGRGNKCTCDAFDPPAGIRTEHVRPPIPTRAFDWTAVRDGYEPGDPIGEGPTERAAIESLLEQEEQRS